jgi:three-Cys-motif partner protein
VADIVGPWAIEKHERLRKYVDAYRSARAKFLPPKGHMALLTLICSRPRSIADRKRPGEFIDGSPLLAYKAAQISGTLLGLHFNDLDQENVDALRQRIARLGGTANYYNEAAEIAVDRIAYALNPAGLHFAFLDPYNLENLPFSIIAKLAKLQRMSQTTSISNVISLSFVLLKSLLRPMCPDTCSRRLGHHG